MLDDLNANARPLAVATVRVSLPTAMSCCPAAPDAVGCASPNAQLETVPAGTDGHISNYASATSSCLATPDSLGCASSKAGLEAVTAGTKKRFSRHASVERMVARELIRCVLWPWQRITNEATDEGYVEIHPQGVDKYIRDRAQVIQC